MGYRMTYTRGKKLISRLNGLKIKEKKEILDTLAYHELYKIDKYIKEDKYESSIDFFAKNNDKKKVWMKRKDEALQPSYGGYTLKKFVYNDSEEIYPKNTTGIYERILNKLQSHFVEKRKFTARMEKKIKSDELDMEIVFTAVINIEYEFGNSDINRADAEYVKEFVISENVQ
ncbi:hypothetical protein [Fusobacterium sp.]|uniref:hypothetical protein n=1 Tax=Fusobacterium sp. TaxID=68766 RepID=UPI0028FFC556|nr:hypothetical protein [Fusobacterium sp.]MDU1911003.1 hypothetical protein [Fusobacterium sp.]